MTARAGTTIAHQVTIEFPWISITGDVVHDAEQNALVLLETESGIPEVLSISLQGYNLTPEPGCVFIKDWSEHEGLTWSLVEAGLGEVTDSLTVGPFESRVFQLKVVSAD